MRPFALLIVFLLSVVARAGDGVAFVTVTSWSEALALAKKSGKPIFLDAYTDWCGWCKVMDKETFANAEVAKVMNASFVNVKMDMERDGGIDVAMKYRITGFPTFMVFKADGTPSYKSFGYQPPEAWLKTLDATTRDQAMAFKGMAAGIDMPWPAWHRKSFLPGKLRTRPTPETAAAWFRSQDDKLSEVAFAVLLRHEVPSDIEMWVLEHEQAYIDRYGEDATGLREAFMEKAFGRACKSKDTMELQRAKNLIVAGDDAERLLRGVVLDATYYQQTTQWKKLASATRRIASLGNVGAYAGRLNEFCWTLYEKTEDADAIEDAIEVMTAVAGLPDADWAHVDTYAALLYRGKRYADAEREARRALALGTAAGADVSGTKDILTKITDAVK
jgi:thioredoxin-related protein